MKQGREVVSPLLSILSEATFQIVQAEYDRGELGKKQQMLSEKHCRFEGEQVSQVVWRAVKEDQNKVPLHKGQELHCSEY